jgi:hypothetical protein
MRWHYQWLIIHQFLVTTVGTDIVEDILANGPKHFGWRNDPYIPLVLRRRLPLRALPGTPELPRELRYERHRPHAAVLRAAFRPTAADPNDPDDLRGGRRAPGASSTGRRSSTSATAVCVATSGSTRRCPRSSAKHVEHSSCSLVKDGAVTVRRPLVARALAGRRFVALARLATVAISVSSLLHGVV